MKIRIESEKELPRAAAWLAGSIAGRNIVSFVGPMGAGKTTIISALCRHLGMVDEASSPTFSIVNEYSDAECRETVYHFDFYRLGRPEEALDIGVEDYFDSGRLCLLEWAENIGEFLPEDAVEVMVTPLDDGSREVEVAGV